MILQLRNSKNKNVASKQNELCCFGFSLVLPVFFCPKFTSNKKQQNSSPARIGGEVSGVALRDVQRFCPRGSQSWDSKKQQKKTGWLDLGGKCGIGWYWMDGTWHLDVTNHGICFFSGMIRTDEWWRVRLTNALSLWNLMRCGTSLTLVVPDGTPVRNRCHQHRSAESGPQQQNARRGDWGQFCFSGLLGHCMSYHVIKSIL